MVDLVTYLIVTCDENNSVREAQRVLHQKGLHATVAFVLEVRGINIVTSKLKIAKLRCG